MSEAVLSKYPPDTVDVIAPTGGYTSGQVLQLSDGRAAYVAGLRSPAAGEAAALQVHGQATVTKTASVVILKGTRVYWDRSANTATPLRAVAGADFYMGVALNDAASADTTVDVDLNVEPNYVFDFHRDPCDTVVVLTAGTPDLKMRGGEAYMAFSATAEAQKIDILSAISVPVTVPMIFECEFQVATFCDADVGDLSVGLANATHASDADSITESAFFHQDSGADLNLDAECDDGTAAEVAATDTTVDVVAGTRVFVQIDARDLTDLKYYVNGVRVLSTTAFDIGDATGPLKALVHFEKSSNDSPGEIRVSHLAIIATDLAE